MLYLGEETLDLRKRKLDKMGMNAIAATFMFIGEFNSLANIRSLNLSHNNIAELPFLMFSRLKNLTCLYVNDNRLSSLPASCKDLEGLQLLDLRNNQLKGLGGVRELPNLRKLLIKGNPLTLEEIRSLIKHVDRTTRKIFVDITGSVTCICGNKSFPYSSIILSRSKDRVSLAL